MGVPVSLIIKVQGASNVIRLFAATRRVATGTFTVPTQGRTVHFFLPPGTGAIVELYAPGNLISAASQLMQRIRIRNQGWPFEPLIY